MSRSLNTAKILAEAFDKALDVLENVLTAAVSDRAALDAARNEVLALTSDLSAANQQIKTLEDDDASASNLIEGIGTKLDGLVQKASASQPPVVTPPVEPPIGTPAPLV